MELLTEEQAKELLEHPFINFTEVAKYIFKEDDAKTAESKLRGRIYSKRIKRVSKDTLEKVTIAFSELYIIMPHSNFL